MSYILEALKKSERERELGHVPGLATPQSAPPLTRRPRWQWVVLAVLVLNALLLSVVLLKREPAPVDTLARLEAPGVVAPVPVPVQEPLPVPPPQPATPLPVPAVPVAAPPPPPAPPLNAQAERLPAPEMAAATQVSAPEQKPAEVAMPIYVPPSPALPTGSERAEAAASPGEQNTAQADSEARTEKADIPLWEEVPYNRRGGLTELNLDVHVYDEKVSRRFILVNLRKYREGDTLSEGPRVEAITPTGARMRYGELRFRLNRP